MTKKQLIITLLTKLKPHRPLAEGFLIVVEWSDDEKIVDQLLVIIHQAMEASNKETANKQLKQSLTVLQKIKMQEAKEVYTEEDLEDLLASIDE